MIWLTPPLTLLQVIHSAVVCLFLGLAGYWLEPEAFVTLIAFLLATGFVQAAQRTGSQQVWKELENPGPWGERDAARADQGAARDFDGGQ